MSKTKFLLALVLLFGICSLAEAVAVTEEFITDGEGTRYRSSTFGGPGTAEPNDFFLRHDYGVNNPFTTGGENQHADRTLLSIGGDPHAEHAWAMEDTVDGGNPYPGMEDGVLRLANITGIPANHSLITLSIEVAAIYSSSADQQDDMETNHGLNVEYAWDSDIPTNPILNVANLALGNYTPVGSFRGQGDITLASDPPIQTLPNTAIPLTNQLQTFNFTIPKQGNTLSVQVKALHLQGGDELVFDNIRVVTAVPEPSAFLFLGVLALVVGSRRYGTAALQLFAHRQM